MSRSVLRQALAAGATVIQETCCIQIFAFPLTEVKRILMEKTIPANGRYITFRAPVSTLVGVDLIC